MYSFWRYAFKTEVGLQAINAAKYSLKVYTVSCCGSGADVLACHTKLMTSFFNGFKMTV